MERTEREEDDLYLQISDAIAAAIAPIEGVTIVPPEGFQAIASGLSQVWRPKGLSGVMIHTGRSGIVLDISVSVTAGQSLIDVGKKVQEAALRALSFLTEPVGAVNVDILKVVI